MAGGVLDIAPAVVWAAALSGLLSFGATLWGYISSPARANGRRLEDMVARVEGHDLRLSRLEQVLQAMPSKDDFHRLQLGMAAIEGGVREVRAVMEGNNRVMERLEAVVTRHEEHLLDGGRR